ncbi:MAG: alpha/beta fold hydrolase [Nannocystaceae bacterium]
MPIFTRPDRSATLAYETAGERGPRVLLVQGTGCVGRGWRPQIDGLAGDHRLAWHDNRGIGGSLPLQGPVSVRTMAEDCLALLDHLGWERAHLVGHSLGGLLVQEAARVAPSRIQSLCLMSTLWRGRDAAIPGLQSLWVTIRARFGAERRRWIALGALPFPRRYLEAIGDDETYRRMRMIFCEDFLKTPPIVRQQVAALWGHRGGEAAPLLGIPTLILTGARDIVVDTRRSDELLGLLPHARLERFADAGHGLPLQHPDAVNELVRAHVAAADP